MGLYGDPAALDALASELSARAREVRTAGLEHRQAGTRTTWVSTAASEYRHRTSADCADVDAAADRMDAAADLLRQHADEVRERLAAIARAEQEVRAWLAGQAARGGELLDQAGAGLGRLPEAGADAWRDVAGGLRRLGLW